MIKRKISATKEYPVIYKKGLKIPKLTGRMKLLVALAATILLITPASTFLKQIIKESRSQQNDFNEEVNSLTPDVQGIETCQSRFDEAALERLYWWNDKYAYRSKINLQTFESFDTQKFVEFQWNHKSLVDANKSRSDGRDVKVVAKQGSNFRVVPYRLENPNSENTRVIFADYQFAQGTTFYLYYSAVPDVNVPELNDLNFNEGATYSINVESEVDYPIKAKLDKEMLLKGYSDALNINIEIDPTLSSTISAVNYEIIGTEVSEAIIASENKYSGLVNVSDLDIGKYSIQATIYDECFNLKSTTENFELIYPLFVVWTMDWEGYDATDQFLNQISEISDKYKVPLTQFYNPRLFVAGNIPRARKDHLNEWIKARKKDKGDEIGLHLHMWNDMIRAAGVTPKNDPNWSNAGNGYDVLFSTYNFNESNVILKWAIKQMEANGMGKPISFRAGGWEIDEENLYALDQNGIKIDSSGRTKHNLGTKLIPSKWDLGATTKPYQPAKSNINSTGPDHLALWEFPNNGADSFVYNVDQLKERFDANMNIGGKEPQVVTYLSHPHWFNVDYPKLNELFSYIDQHNYEKNNGIVVFATLSEVYEYWTKLQE